MHEVVKESSSTTKLRIVFDALALTTSGNSLNDSRIPGTCMYPAIPDLLIKFRTHKVAMTADVSKMFTRLDYRKQTVISTDFSGDQNKGLSFRLPE